MNEPYWRIVIDDRARKDLRRIDPPTRDRIARAIRRLAQNAELDRGTKSLRRIREKVDRYAKAILRPELADADPLVLFWRWP